MMKDQNEIQQMPTLNTLNASHLRSFALLFFFKAIQKFEGRRFVILHSVAWNAVAENWWSLKIYFVFFHSLIVSEMQKKKIKNNKAMLCVLTRSSRNLADMHLNDDTILSLSHDGGDVDGHEWWTWADMHLQGN